MSELNRSYRELGAFLGGRLPPRYVPWYDVGVASADRGDDTPPTNDEGKVRPKVKEGFDNAKRKHRQRVKNGIQNAGDTGSRHPTIDQTHGNVYDGSVPDHVDALPDDD